MSIKTLENKPPRAQRSNSSTPGKVLGVGTGTTVNFLIDELAARGVKLAGAVSSSNGSTRAPARRRHPRSST